MISRIGGSSFDTAAACMDRYSFEAPQTNPDSSIGEQESGESDKNADTNDESSLSSLIASMEKENGKYKLNAITTKLNSGKKLSNYELNYLKKENPALYTRAKSIQQERKALERRLKQCRSKAEVRNLQNSRLFTAGGSMQTQSRTNETPLSDGYSGIPKQDGWAAEYNQNLSARIANTNDVCLEYRKTHKLPEVTGRPKHDQLTLSRKQKKQI